VEVVEGGEVHRGLTPFVIRTEEQLAAAVEHLEYWPVLTLDVETDSAHPKTNEIIWIGLAVGDRVFLIPMGHPLGRILVPASTEKRLPPEEERSVLKSGKLSATKKTYHVPATFGDPGQQLRQDQVFGALRPLLFSSRTKVGHNLKFDLESIAKYYGGEIPPGPYFDTLILTHLLDESLPNYSLKTLVMDWLKVPKKPPEIRKDFYPNLGKVGVQTQPIDEVARYLAKDVWYTHLYRLAKLEELQREPTLMASFDIEMAVYPSLMQAELNGIRIDTDLLNARGEQLRGERQALAERIWDICGEEYAISNYFKKRDFLFGDVSTGHPTGQGLKPLTYTVKTNAPQLNTKCLEHYAPKNELARLYLEWADKEKLIGTFIEGLEKRMVNGRLHTSFNQHRTVTGRLSSNNPNLQQIPRGEIIRETFICDPEWSMVVADYDQVELRCSAFLSQDPQMIRVFQENMDIHTEAAAVMYEINPTDVTKDQRQVGKTMNFGTLYGAGPDKISETAQVDTETAQAFIRRYYSEYRRLSDWKDEMVRKARMTGSRKHKRVPYAEIPPWGRRRRLPDLYSSEIYQQAKAERQVVNSIVQGFAANIMKLAMIDLYEEIDRTPYQLLLNVHDELIIQAPRDYEEKAKDWLVDIMEGVTHNGDPILGTVPLTVEAGIGRNWSDCK
jgi:DNA polymerase-1